MEKPLPDRIRPLEGAGLTIMSLGMGCERRRWKWAGPACAVLIAAGLVALAWVGVIR